MTVKFGFQVTVQDRTIWLFPEDITAAAATAKHKLNAGITYNWTRGLGEDPIMLGSLGDLTDFIDKNIIGPTTSWLRPDFNVTKSLDTLIAGLPSPVDTALKDTLNHVNFKLDGLRLQIPEKSQKSDNSQGSTEEKKRLKFELAMLVDLINLPEQIQVGHLQLNQIYIQLGNFGSSGASSSKSNP